MRVALSNLLQQIGLSYVEDIDITGIEFDSRKINQGNLFVAISGHESDGHTYIKEAIDNGAVAIIGEKDLEVPISLPYYKVHNSRETLSILANHFYQMPHNKHKIVGITGTNGKTTTAYMLRHILSQIGKTVSMIGTIEYYLNGINHESELTTPDAISLHRMLHESNDEYVIMEVSSHGLDQYRVTGPMFDYALFTNLSHEHLDYHSDFENYYQTKKKLFNCLKSDGKAIIGAYTSWGERLYEELFEEKIPLISFCHRNKKENIYLKSFISTPKATLLINDHGSEYIIRMNKPGKHNVFNAFGSYITVRNMGFSPEQIINALESFEGAPGRFEEIIIPNGAKAFIDYAHTPDGLNYALHTANDCIEKGLYHIFGFRGKRDVSKRKEMVEISHNISNHVFLTLDDLNGIEKEQMLQELHELSKPYSNVTIIDDRTEAIALVMNQLKNGEGMFVTGKGPEKYKEQYRYQTLTDKETVLEILANHLVCESVHNNHDSI